MLHGSNCTNFFSPRARSAKWKEIGRLGPRISRRQQALDSANQSLYLIKLLDSSYPEGKLRKEPVTRWFDEFSPLVPRYGEQFARQYRYGPPSEFPLCPSEALFTIFRVQTRVLLINVMPRLSDLHFLMALYFSINKHRLKKHGSHSNFSNNSWVAG